MNKHVKRKILVIGPCPPPYGGWGHVVSSLTAPPFSDFYRISVFDTKLRNDVGEILNKRILIKKAISQNFRLPNLLYRERPEFVILCSGPGGSFWRDLIFFGICKIMNVPIIIRFFGGTIVRNLQKSFPILSRIIFWYLFLSKAFLVETEEMCSDIKHLNSKANVFRVPNFINLDNLPVVSSIDSVSPSMSVIYIGNMDELKGVETIINCVDSVNEEVSVTFHFIGGELVPGYLDRVRDLASKKRFSHAINIHGRMARSEAHTLASQCHIFAFPTKWPGEGQPAALIESMGIGLAPIATSWRGIKEIITHNNNGILIDIDNSEELANSIVKLSKDVDFRNHISKNARDSIYNKYSVDVAVDLYEKIFAVIFD